jgi:tRNA(Ile)-lysidine synthase
MPCKLEQQIIFYIRQEKLIENGDNLLLAVSGGADSTALLLLFNNVIRNLFEINISVAHLNHSLRGKESDDDQRFVEKLCADNNLKIFSKKQRIDVLKGESKEEAARRVRHTFLKETAECVKANKIVTAHHLDDQAETVLFRIMAGTGLTGLSGIAPSNSPYIRPLLSSRREVLEEYLKNNKQVWRNDKSNSDISIPRNKIRHRLLPFLKKEFGEHIPETLSRLADNCRITPDKSTAAKLLVDAFCFSYGLTEKLSNSCYSRLLKLATSTTGETDIGGGFVAMRSNKGIKLVKKKNHAHNVNIEYSLKIKEGKHLLPNGKTLHIRRAKNKNGVILPSAESGTAFFDADKFNEFLTIRTYTEGDRFTPLGSKGAKKLSDFFIDSKVLRLKRSSVLLFCSHNEIAWVTGLRISEKFKISEKTENILIFEIGI